MKSQKFVATVVGQSIIHITKSYSKPINNIDKIVTPPHLIGELKLLTDEERVVYVRCPTHDGAIEIEENTVPDHKQGMQLYNTIVCKHPFGSRRVIQRTEEMRYGKPTNKFKLLQEDPETFERKDTKTIERKNPETAEHKHRKRPVFNQQLQQQLAEIVAVRTDVPQETQVEDQVQDQEMVEATE